LGRKTISLTAVHCFCRDVVAADPRRVSCQSTRREIAGHKIDGLRKTHGIREV
jgi:hypothetical protein